MKVAFLIEGAMRSEGQYPEVTAAIALAQKNGCEIFDPIELYSAIPTKELITELHEDEWRLFVIFCVLQAGSVSFTDDIYRTYIEPSFQVLIDKKVIASLPSWLTQLSAETWHSFVATLMLNYYSNCEKKLEKGFTALTKSLDRLKVDLSLLNLLKFLEVNDEVTHVFSLVSEEHLNFIDSLEHAKIIEQNETMRKYELEFENQKIIIELYAGKPGQMDHFILMQQAYLKHCSEQSIAEKPTDTRRAEADSEENTAHAVEKASIPIPTDTPSAETETEGFAVTSIVKDMLGHVSSALGNFIGQLERFTIVKHMQSTCQQSGVEAAEVTANPFKVMFNDESLRNLFVAQLRAKSSSPEPHYASFFVNKVDRLTAEQGTDVDCILGGVDNSFSQIL